MSDESIIIFTSGVLLLLFGLGIAVVRVDNDSFQKDRRRFGKPIPLLNMMGWYYFFRYRLFRLIFAVMFIIFGIFLVYYAMSE